MSEIGGIEHRDAKKLDGGIAVDQVLGDPVMHYAVGAQLPEWRRFRVFLTQITW